MSVQIPLSLPLTIRTMISYVDCRFYFRTKSPLAPSSKTTKILHFHFRKASIASPASPNDHKGTTPHLPIIAPSTPSASRWVASGRREAWNLFRKHASVHGENDCMHKVIWLCSLFICLRVAPPLTIIASSTASASSWVDGNRREGPTVREACFCPRWERACAQGEIISI